MATKENAVAGFYSLTNEHLGIIIQSLAEKQPLHGKSEKIAEITKNKSRATTEPSTKERVEGGVFNLEISSGETAGRAVLLPGETNAEIESFWVFRSARSQEDMDQNHFQLLKKLPKASESHLFVDECYQARTRKLRTHAQEQASLAT
jgi:hypothetical protein